MVFASVREHPSTAIFLRARAEIKKFALRAANSLESTTRELRALMIFSACSNPYMEILFFKMKQKIFETGF